MRVHLDPPYIGSLMQPEHESILRDSLSAWPIVCEVFDKCVQEAFFLVVKPTAEDEAVDPFEENGLVKVILRSWAMPSVVCEPIALGLSGADNLSNESIPVGIHEIHQVLARQSGNNRMPLHRPVHLKGKDVAIICYKSAPGVRDLLQEGLFSGFFVQTDRVLHTFPYLYAFVGVHLRSPFLHSLEFLRMRYPRLYVSPDLFSG